jgi:hypothetical protein
MGSVLPQFMAKTLSKDKFKTIPLDFPIKSQYHLVWNPRAAEVKPEIIQVVNYLEKLALKDK